MTDPPLTNLSVTGVEASVVTQPVAALLRHFDWPHDWMSLLRYWVHSDGGAYQKSLELLQEALKGGKCASRSHTRT